MTSLLKILHPYHPELPFDGRTQLSTPRRGQTHVVSGGHFVYFGILHGLRKLLDHGFVASDVLNLQVNIDGLPLYCSRTTCFWPILVAVKECVPLRPFAAAVYCGLAKPECPHSFLSRFVSEIKSLISDRIPSLGKCYSVRFHSLVCDTPARAIVKCIKGYNGYSACERCEVKGEYFAEGKKVIYRDQNVTKRNGHS